MKRIAIVKDGIVENITLWDGENNWNPGDGVETVDVTDIECDVGYRLENRRVLVAPTLIEEKIQRRKPYKKIGLAVAATGAAIAYLVSGSVSSKQDQTSTETKTEKTSIPSNIDP